MHTKRKSAFSAAAVFAGMFLLLLCLIPGLHVSAVTKYYTVGCAGDKISYSNSNVTSFSSNSNVTVSCSNKGSYSITVKPNTSTSQRTITLYAKKNSSTTVDTLSITQQGIPSTTLSTAACTGGNLYWYCADAYSYSYSNTAVCSSRSGSNFVVKPNSSTSSRSCKVTVKNKAGNVIYYVNINQNAVPSVTINAACTGGNYVWSGASNYTYSYGSTGVCSSRSGNSFVVKANTSTNARSCKVTVKNGAGNVVYYININQSAVPVKTVKVGGGYTSFSYGNSNAAYLETGNTKMIYNRTASNPGSYTVYVSANPSTSTKRSNRITVKNNAKQIIAYIDVNQEVGVAAVQSSVSYDCTSHSFTYTCANADPSKTMYTTGGVCTCTKQSGSTFQIKVNANTTTSARTCTITLRDKFETPLAKYTIKQSGVPTKTINPACMGGNYTWSASGASSYSYSNTAVCSSRSGNSFVVKANTATSSRSCKVTVKNNAGETIYYVNINQDAVPTKEISTACMGGSYNWTTGGASTYTYSDPTFCSRSGSNFVVKPNTTIYARSSKVTVKNSAGKIIYYVTIHQDAVPSTTIQAGFTGGNYSWTTGGASTYDFGNAAVCNSRSGNLFVVKPNTTISARTCKVTVKNKAGQIIYYVNINQEAVPLKQYKVGGGYSSFSYSKSGASTLTPSNKTMIYNVTASNPGSYTVYVAANPSNTKSRTTRITVKKSSTVIEYIDVEQDPRPIATSTDTFTAAARTITHNYANAVRAEISNPAMCSCTKIATGKFQVKLTANTGTTTPRFCTITFRDQFDTILEKYSITQSGEKPNSSFISYDRLNDIAYIKAAEANASVGSVKEIDSFKVRGGFTTEFYRGDKYGTPNEMNCTVICIMDLLNYYHKIPSSGTLNTSNIYNKLITDAKAKGWYTDKSGLSILHHKDLCAYAFKLFGYQNVNIDTFSRPQSAITVANLSDELKKGPFILSSTTAYHSIVVTGWHKIRYTLDQKQYGSSAACETILFECFDPNGDIYYLEQGEIAASWSDLEQVMFVNSLS